MPSPPATWGREYRNYIEVNPILWVLDSDKGRLKSTKALIGGVVTERVLSKFFREAFFQNMSFEEVDVHSEETVDSVSLSNEIFGIINQVDNLNSLYKKETDDYFQKRLPINHNLLLRKVEAL